MNRAICLGEILIDCFSEQPGLPRSATTSWAPLPGGALANIACAIAKLGDPVEFIGAVGQDHWGNALLKLLDDMGVGHAGIQRRLKAPTRKAYFTQTDFTQTKTPHPRQDKRDFPKERLRHRTFAGFSDDPVAFADAHLFADAIDPLLFAGAKFLILGTSSLAHLDTQQSVERAVNLAAHQNVSILVDVNWQPMFWNQPAEAPASIYSLIQKSQYLKISADEAEWLFATRSAIAIAQQLPHLKGVLVTDNNSCRYWLHSNAGTIPGFKVDIEDTAGAREAFTAGFIHQLLQKGQHCLQAADTARQVVIYASAVGALTTTRPGAIAALPTPKEIEVFLYLNQSKLTKRT